MGGLHPVVAVYATFLNRAFDQVLMDVALHRCGVTFVLDRAGVTGDDGASHNGMWDMSVLQVVPGLRLAAPRDAGPAARAARRGRRGRRRPDRGALPQGRRRPTTSRPSAGPAAPTSWSATAPATCWSSASARWRRRPSTWPSGWSPRASASPSSTRAGSSRSTRRSSSSPATTGWWSASRTTAWSAAAGRCCCRRSTDAGVTTPVRLHGIPQEFLDHAKRDAILERIGLTPQAIALEVVELMSQAAGESLTSDVPH